MSLSSLLKSGLLKGRYKFPSLQKTELAFTLAQSLLQFYGGPWLPEYWTSETLFFKFDPETAKVHNIHQPYILCPLSSKYNSGSELLDPTSMHHSFLSFGKLLMELDSGEIIDTTHSNELGRRTPNLFRCLWDYFKKTRKGQLHRRMSEIPEMVPGRPKRKFGNKIQGDHLEKDCVSAGNGP